jgi:hypothetical protein
MMKEWELLRNWLNNKRIHRLSHMVIVNNRAFF